MAERMALNAPIQGSAADVIKVAMLRVAAALKPLSTRGERQAHDLANRPRSRPAQAAQAPGLRPFTTSLSHQRQIDNHSG